MNEVLVSIVVVNYNSERFIMETLESIRNQSYFNIELIISDDNSCDNSVIIAKKWLSDNEDRFINTVLICNCENTGISANLNRGIKICQGKYIKIIASDDILHHDAIKEYVMYSEKNNLNVAFSDVYRFNDSDVTRSELNDYQINKEIFNLSQEKLYKKVLVNNYFPAPSSFIKRDIFLKIGLFDEKYKMIEDWPYWVKLLEKNIRISFLDKKLVYYRIHNNSITNNKNKLYNEKYINDLYKFYRNIRRGRMIKKGLILRVIDTDMEFKYIQKVISSGNNIEGITLRSYLYLWLSPLYVYRIIKRKYATLFQD